MSSVLPIRSRHLLPAVLLGIALVVPAAPAQADVALMAGQRARPLQGRFNAVPVLHSNQPEEVEGPGILINTAPGVAYAVENRQPLRNPEFTFNGEFGFHFHHKYFPPNRASISPAERRAELTLAAILMNPGPRPVHIQFSNGAVRNSFEAPYLANNLMGVKPLGRRPWNTGPGDATAVQMLRGGLDDRLRQQITIPPRSRIVLFHTRLPALGIANALLRGRSDGPFQVAVVAAKNPRSDADIFAVLDSRWLAPGRVYLGRVAEINRRQIFSRVGGVALGDHYQASITHDLTRAGPLHVPFTSTDRHHFGTRDVQVNPLAVRTIDSSLDNVGTYGVRFDVDLKLQGNGPYELVMSHPTPRGSGRQFTAFRGSLQIRTPEGLREVHVGLRSGESLALTRLDLRPGAVYPVRVSMVYPADATPGHLLSVVPEKQLSLLQQRERQQQPTGSGEPATPPAPKKPAAVRPAAPARPPAPAPAVRALPSLPPPPVGRRAPLAPPPTVPVPSRGSTPSLIERYRKAVEAQQEKLRGRPAP